MARLRLFGPAREAAGTACAEVAGASVGDVLADAVRRFGPAYAGVAARSMIWVNGEEATDDTKVSSDDEVAVLPPVSGGA